MRPELGQPSHYSIQHTRTPLTDTYGVRLGGSPICGWRSVMKKRILSTAHTVVAHLLLTVVNDHIHMMTAGYIPRLRSPMCTSSRWVIRNPVIPSVSTADLGCDVTSVPFTKKRTWELPTSTTSVFVDRP